MREKKNNSEKASKLNSPRNLQEKSQRNPSSKSLKLAEREVQPCLAHWREVQPRLYEARGVHPLLSRGAAALPQGHGGAPLLAK
ncbi:hypothetical protein TorRG33x02_184130 [Trema orientale]|uniref:Uncharacterized protein n=1 Tax=Trema orientale TaxID=63057 RepID=A0A2P5EJT6_TREOI|nr:hypothetical protein TorRG33x02_184130 [Trema orientale]